MQVEGGRLGGGDHVRPVADEVGRAAPNLIGYQDSMFGFALPQECPVFASHVLKYRITCAVVRVMPLMTGG